MTYIEKVKRKVRRFIRSTAIKVFLSLKPFCSNCKDAGCDDCLYKCQTCKDKGCVFCKAIK